MARIVIERDCSDEVNVIIYDDETYDKIKKLLDDGGDWNTFDPNAFMEEYCEIKNNATEVSRHHMQTFCIEKCNLPPITEIICLPDD